MSPDDFAVNLTKINDKKMDETLEIVIPTLNGCPNFAVSLNKKLQSEGFPLSSSRIKIERRASKWETVKMEVFTENPRWINRPIIGYANFDTGMEKILVFPFKEVATTDYGVITPMNGWESPGSTPVAVRSGRYVDINFGFENGVATHGTVIGKVPEGFRPCETRTIPVIADAHAEYARLVVYTNGDIKLFGANEATKKIVGTGGYMI